MLLVVVKTQQINLICLFKVTCCLLSLVGEFEPFDLPKGVHWDCRGGLLQVVSQYPPLDKKGYLVVLYKLLIISEHA